MFLSIMYNLRPIYKPKLKKMKKLILSFAIVALATLGANAQAKFGVKAAMNISSIRISGDGDEGLKSLIGANGGFFATIPVSTNFTIQPEVLYSAEGAKAEEGDGKIVFGYVNIPVMLQYRHESGFIGELGPQLGILTSAKVKSDGDSEDIKESLKTTNFSLAIGAGFNFTPAIGVGVRYSLGLSNIVDVEGAGEWKTSNFSVGVHYTFGQSK